MPATDAVIGLDHAFGEDEFLEAAREPEFGFAEGGAWPAAQSYLRQFHDSAVKDDLDGLSMRDVLHLAAEFWAFAAGRTGREQIRIRAAAGRDGRPLGRDVLEILSADRPFLVDSAMAEIAGHGLDVLAMFHPIVSVARDGDGQRRGDGPTHAESMIQVHLAPLSDAQRDSLKQSLGEVLDDVRQATEDWRAMLAEMDAAIAELDGAAIPDGEEKAEGLAFLRWLRDDHFAFLGARTYEFQDDGAAIGAQAVEGASLGVLRDPERHILRPTSEPVLTRDFLSEPAPVVVAKSNMRSRVHRRVIADFISVKRYGPDGDVIGERRFLGLFTSDAYYRMVRDVPLIRRKAQYVLDRAADMGGHSAKKLRNIVETYPRDDLFQISEENLLKIALGVLHLEDRPRPRLFLRQDRFDRFVSALVYVPRERYSADLRARIGELLRRSYDGRLSAFYPHFTDGALARVQFIIGLEPGKHPQPDPRAMERAIARLARSWDDEFEAHLRTAGAGPQTRAAAERYAPGFSAGYRERFTADEALADILKMQALERAGGIETMAYRRAGDGDGVLRFKIYHRGEPLPLSRVMPILETLDLEVIWEQGHCVGGNDHADDDHGPDCIWIHDFELRLPDGAESGPSLRARFENTFTAVWRGETEADRFNALVLRAGAHWRDAAFLRACARYRQQANPEISQTMQEDAMCAHPEIARLLLDLRDARFDPAADFADMAARRARCKDLDGELNHALDAVRSLDFDRALRRIARVIQAVQRTNAFQRGADGAPKSHIALKIASRELDDLPEPKPYREIFVWAPHVEGVHLRFGAVARGGLRWSDRRDDFRTEVLSLVKAQQVKNAVIVPAGAKGGFYPKRLPAGGAREDIQAAGIEAYKTFIGALLDVTDNIVDGGVVPPPDVVRWDDDDPYLVVAADKGTATFSDIANGVAAQYGFWLGDAFASGGSAGYDHKAMGITARGAWEAVKRHFRELGKDIQTEPFTVIGVGDMSGDVFGNGMLLSRQIRLLAAFDHRDIFIDPDPDPAASYAERERLFALPRSSWRDYDSGLISEGGGVFSRAEKSISLTPQIKALTGLTQDSVAPSALIHALLTSPCELLWFGGIGTYVKAGDEQHWQAGDRVNDSLRADGRQLRALVIGEGANLGVTQRGRIEFARNGGRINTDAVDNSAGVDTSDHEVNIKILLKGAMESGALAPEDRGALLAAMTDDVARHVLRHNYDQTLAISLAEDRAARDLDAHERLILDLEADGRLDRTVEDLPSGEEIAALREAGNGLTRPEIAVLVAYSKIALSDAICASSAPDDPHFRILLDSYFPAQLERFGREMESHRLKRDIVSTVLAGEMINLGGPAFISQMREMTGAEPADAARAFEAARRIFGYDSLTERINALDNIAPAAAQTLLHRDTLRLLRRQTQWLARRARTAGDAPRPVQEMIQAYRDGVERLKGVAHATMSDFQHARMRARVAAFTEAGAPEDLAEDAATLLALGAATDIIDLADGAGWTPEAAAFLYHRLGGRLSMDSVRAAADETPADQHWSRLAARRMVESLYGAQARLAASAARFARQAGGALLDGAATPDGDWAEALTDAWADQNSDEMRRAEAAIAELTGSGGWSLAKISIADSTYREFAEQARPRPE